MKKILLGNEAIVQGALEAGVEYATAYPGTPSSEIGNVFAKLAKKNNAYFEFATNEKTALESSIGASYSGMKTLTAMKNFGLNVALDSFLPFCYTGVNGASVIVVADDPSCWSSGQSEENSRAFAYLSNVPFLEPSDPQEAKDFTKLGYEISEQFKIPVVLRITTRVAHQSMPVSVERIDKQRKKAKFTKGDYLTMPPRVLEQKQELLAKLEKIKRSSLRYKLNKIEKGERKDMGIIVSGISYLHLKESQEILGENFPILKIGLFYPLDEKIITEFLQDFKKVLIIEELEGYLEKEVRIIAQKNNLKTEIIGKDNFPVTGELNVNIINNALANILKKEISPKKTNGKIEKRLPRFCPGCPYWYVFSTIKKIAPNDVVYGGDIGCYMLGSLAPHNMADFMLCMGASIGVGHGINKASNQNVISFIGDSTFFHAGIPALINAVFNKSKILIIILDNQITAMTGHQTNPGLGITAMEEKTKEIKIEEIVKACGVENLKVLDPQDIKEFEKTAKDYLNKEGVSVIIARRMCALLAKRYAKQ
ncbi:MAG: thiamine pyrophosphate-dependent enzyme [Candidatus Pacebacteria bacterium]|nr:thiamine pyrophosphate-dependent enzyme [Candidatus Paceibacterota bacterium]